MFPTPTLVPSKDFSGVRFSTSPAGHKPCSVPRAQNPKGLQRNLEARAALRMELFSLSPCCFLGYAEHGHVFPPVFQGSPQLGSSPHDDPKNSSQARTDSSKLSHTATCCHQGDAPGTSWGPSCWKMLCKQRLSHCPLNSRLLAFDKAPGFPALPPATQTPRNPGFPPVPPAT